MLRCSSRYRAVTTLAAAFALRRVNHLPNGEEPSRSKYSITLRSGMTYSNIYVTNVKRDEVVICGPLAVDGFLPFV
jgi:hypothetical protein